MPTHLSLRQSVTIMANFEISILKKQTLHIFILLMIFCFGASAQNNLHQKKIFPHDTVLLDTLMILPSTVAIKHQGKTIAKSWYKIDIVTGKLISTPLLQAIKDSLTITYRTLNTTPPQTMFSRKGKPIPWKDNDIACRYALASHQYDIGFLNDSQLQKQGSYVRGISYGNQQDVVMNSSLNLQLSGKISEDIHILASISDDNIPIQPDGNTQNIQEFDRIFIQLFNDTQKLTIGDYEIDANNGIFMRCFKKVQGGAFSGTVRKTKNGNQLKSMVSAAISKGKFNRMQFRGEEGVQGPYRLYGVNQESYIVVLSGTERVFVDGIKKMRGEQFDYTINYNTAEIIFNTNCPISNNSRIVVEFEYSEESYARYLLFSSNKYTHKRGDIWLNIYHQQDSKNKPIDQALSKNDKQLLQAIGDNINHAQVSTAQQVPFSDNFILYRKVNKTVADSTYQIYEYSTNPQEAIYKVTFTLVGTNKGNYIQEKSLANGNVFKWVAPINGVPQGNYAPIKQLTAPTKQQMLTAGTSYQSENGWKAFAELALSNFDSNTYSSLNDTDNRGVAIDLSLEKHLNFADTNQMLQSKVTARWIQNTFQPIENFRSVEFYRNWNITQPQHSNEKYIQISNQFIHRKWGNIAYHLAMLKQGDIYSGINNQLQTNYRKKRIEVQINSSWLSTEQQNIDSRFLKHLFNASYAFSFGKLGIETQNEHNRFRNIISKNLLPQSFANYAYKVYLQSSDAAIRPYHLFYQSRVDLLPYLNRFAKVTQSDNWGAGLWLKKNRNNQLKLTANYRRLRIKNIAITKLQPENTLLTQIEHRANIKKGLLRTSTFYQLGAGLESKKNYTYLEVNPGQGIYQWIDYNKNKVKELNEFEVAPFKDQANYIRIANYTTQYEKVYTGNFRQTFYLQLHSFKGKGKWGNFISRFSNRFAYRIAKKSLKHQFNLYGNPFSVDLNNGDITTVSANFNNTLTYRQPKWSVDAILQSNKSKQLLLQGFEYRKQQQKALQFTYQPTSESRIINRFELATQQRENDIYDNKNFKLSQITNELKLLMQPSLKFQFEIKYEFQQQKNRWHTEKATQHCVGAEVQYAMTKNGTISGNFNYFNIGYNASTNSAIAHEMLNAFLPGNNATWQLQWHQQLSKIFQMDMVYNGRKSENTQTVHIGSVQLRAYF